MKYLLLILISMGSFAQMGSQNLNCTEEGISHGNFYVITPDMNLTSARFNNDLLEVEAAKGKITNIKLVQLDGKQDSVTSTTEEIVLFKETTGKFEFYIKLGSKQATRSGIIVSGKVTKGAYSIDILNRDSMVFDELSCIAPESFYDSL